MFSVSKHHFGDVSVVLLASVSASHNAAKAADSLVFLKLFLLHNVSVVSSFIIIHQGTLPHGVLPVTTR